LEEDIFGYIKSNQEEISMISWFWWCWDM